MQKLVLDSSVFIKLFIDEEDSNIASDLMDAIIDNQTQIIVARIFYYEIFGIAKKRKVDCDNLLNILQDYEGSLLTYITETHEITKQALKITKKGNERSGFPTFYDSVYHAIAILNNCDFITADKRHYDKAKDFGHIKMLTASDGKSR